MTLHARTSVAWIVVLIALAAGILGAMRMPEPPPTAPLRAPIASISPTDPAGR